MNTVKKHLSLQPLIEGFKSAFGHPPDDRRQSHISYRLEDVALSGLACMFYQSGDMVKYQASLKKKYQRNNFETQFGILDTPKDTQMRALTAKIPSRQFADVFKNYQTRLQRSNQLKAYQFMGKYLVALDGTEYYTSEKISCSCCLTRKKRNGIIEYHHKALQPIICHPSQKQILPMMPEAIANTDGQTKQDCEVNAGKRLLPKLRKQHPRMPFIWLADSIFGTAPFISEIIANKEDFIFRVKQGEHRELFKQLDTAAYQGHRTIRGNSTLAMRWYPDIRLNNSTDITVTVIKAFIITMDQQGNKTSTIVGVWITNLAVDSKNIIAVTQAARARWKIENECFNTVKNQGYELTHNWGHVNGEAFNFYILVMLGFYLHQILSLTDNLFQQCRKLAKTHYNLWTDLAGLFKWFVFDSWEHILCYFLDESGGSPPGII